MSNLYFIENQGCDATTLGLVRISDVDFPKFKTLIEDLIFHLEGKTYTFAQEYFSYYNELECVV